MEVLYSYSCSHVWLQRLPSNQELCLPFCCMLSLLLDSDTFGMITVLTKLDKLIPPDYAKEQFMCFFFFYLICFFT